MQDNANLQPFETQSFLQHIQMSAELAGAPFSRESSSRVLEVLQDELPHSPLGWKTNSLSKRQLYFNVYNQRKIDLLGLLRRGGLVPQEYLTHREANALYRLVQSRQADGADFNAATGLCKVWIYTQMAPIASLSSDPNVPQALRSFVPVMQSFGLERHFFIASDFEKNSMNLYVPWQPDQRNEAWIQRFAVACGGSELATSTLGSLLAVKEFATGIGITFKWDQDGPQRACFYAACPSASLVAPSVELLALRERMRLELPSLRREPHFYTSYSFGAAGEYLKFEKNYCGDMMGYISTAYGLDPNDPHLSVGGAIG